MNTQGTASVYEEYKALYEEALRDWQAKMTLSTAMRRDEARRLWELVQAAYIEGQRSVGSEELNGARE